MVGLELIRPVPVSGLHTTLHRIFANPASEVDRPGESVWLALSVGSVVAVGAVIALGEICESWVSATVPAWLLCWKSGSASAAD